MGLLTALPTHAGIAILNSELRQEVRRFVLIGHAEREFEDLDTLLAGDLMAVTHAQIQPYIFFTRNVERAYFDDEGVLTFSLLVPHEDDLGKTIYALGLITEAEEGESPTLVSLSKTPKIPKVANVGGHFTYKVAVRGEAAQVVFRNRNLVTATELNETRENLEQKIIHSGMPVGAILPIAAHLQGSYDLPEGGDVSGEGWMRCDGAAIPEGNRLQGTVPDLTDGRFLRGADRKSVV